jgi:hypothetical protein
MGKIMKKLLSFILCFALAIGIVGCNSDENTTPIAPDETSDESQNVIDVDLTGFSAVMAYSTFVDLWIQNSMNYIGQTIRLRGAYDPIFSPATERDHLGVLIPGSSPTCCPKWAEFKWDGELPPIGTEIEVTGVLGFYDEAHFIDLRYLAAVEVRILG